MVIWRYGSVDMISPSSAATEMEYSTDLHMNGGGLQAQEMIQHSQVLEQLDREKSGRGDPGLPKSQIDPRWQRGQAP
jgi:hypothetical protein